VVDTCTVRDICNRAWIDIPSNGKPNLSAARLPYERRRRNGNLLRNRIGNDCDDRHRILACFRNGTVQRKRLLTTPRAVDRS